MPHLLEFKGLHLNEHSGVPLFAGNVGPKEWFNSSSDVKFIEKLESERERERCWMDWDNLLRVLKAI